MVSIFLPIVNALAKIIPERMKTIIEALPKTVTSFRTIYWPQNLDKTEMPIRYNAEKMCMSQYLSKLCQRKIKKSSYL